MKQKKRKNFISHQLSSISQWAREHNSELFLLLIIIAVSAFMRLYKISEYMTFLGDEGRDVIIVRRFLENGDIMLIGPGTSIGNMYLGPLYYYMMAPALLVFMYSPLGPAVMIALLSVVTVWFIWFATREWFGTKAAFVAAALYAIAPTVIIYSRSSWNPNIMPFFALLSVWGIWKVWKEGKLRWFIVVGVGFAACLQSHYLGLLLAAPIGLFWALTIFKFRNSFSKVKLILNTLLMAVVFLLLMSPLAIFDFRHNFINFNAIKAFFTDRQTTVSIKPWKAIPTLYPQFDFVMARLVSGYSLDISKWVSIFSIGAILLAFKQTKNIQNRKGFFPLILLVVWLGSGVTGLALYKQQIYDHYYGFIFPAFFILAGLTFSKLWEFKRLIGPWLAVSLFLLLVWVNLNASPLKYSPNRQFPRSVEVAEFILKEANGSKFNFAVIAERNYEGAYQYFLEKNEGFRVIDPQNTKETIADSLYVVCEMEKAKCDPTHNAKTEVAAFGWSKIDNTWEVSGVLVFKLTHNYPTTNTAPKAK